MSSLFRFQAAAKMESYIVAGNVPSPGADVSGTFASPQYDLTGVSNSASFVNGTNRNIVGTAANPDDSQLGPLANNGCGGCFTSTHALLAGSPAINAGSNPLALDENGAPLSRDQRGFGFDRIRNVTVDMGSFEVQTATPTPTPCGTPGSLDTSFGGTGKVTTAVGTVNDHGEAIAIQTDGKTIVAGESRQGSSPPKSYFTVVRYNVDGTLDTSFDGDGIATTLVENGRTVIDPVGVVIQPSDNKIVVAGTSVNSTKTNYAVVRFNTDGSLDTTFGTGGVVVTQVGTAFDFARALTIQGDGKIVVAGDYQNGSKHDFGIVRYNADGSLDSSFGTGGKALTPVGTVDDVVYTVGTDSQNRIVAGGYSSSGVNYDFSLIRLTSGGALDSSFGTGGKVVTPVGTGTDIARSLAIQTDDKIVLVGDIQTSGTPFDYAAVRYNTDGTLDTSFGGTGKVTFPFGTSDNFVYGTAIQADGKIVLVGGSKDTNSNYTASLARLNSDGSLDSSFGTGGKVVTSYNSSQSYYLGVKIRPDGRIATAGFSGNIGVFIAARYFAQPCSAPTPSPSPTPTPTPTPMISISVDTVPTGRSFTVDGIAYATAQNFSWVSGSVHTIATTTPQQTAGARYDWSSWSDGGGISHTVSPTGSTNYVANFTANDVTVSGRVVTSDFRGLRNATVSMTDPNGVVRTATTSSFGLFSFANVTTGVLYVFRVQSRLYRYAPVRVTINDEITLPDFVGLE